MEASNENAASRSDSLPSASDQGGGAGRRAEAERRRALALRALDQRLNAAAATRMAGGSVASPLPTVAGDAPESVVDAVAEPPAQAVNEAQA